MYRKQSMSWKLKILALATIAALGGILAPMATAGAAGLLSPADGRLPPLRIKDHQVSVVIEDGYAVTKVEQTFSNPHPRDLEAVYSFPVPDHAAVSEFTYWIDGRPVSGEVLARPEARRLYEAEKSAGNETALAEQDSHKTFELSVWPVRAGGDVRIRLVYLQAASLDSGIGRYVYPLEEGTVDEDKLAFWTANDEVSGRFSFDLALRSAYPVAAVRLPEHPQAAIERVSDGIWRVRMDNAVAAGDLEESGVTPAGMQVSGPSPAHRLDKDIVVYWRHAAGLPGSVELTAYKADPEGRGTFMLVLTPGDDLKPITEGADWIFVLDKSGSMRSKIHTLIAGVERALGKLRPEDRFRVVVFDTSARDLTGGLIPATPENVQRSLGLLRGIQPGNGTNLFAGLDSGLSRLDADRTATVLLVTDGVANVGEVKHRAFLDLVRRQDVRLFTFIMGNSANRPLLEAMTRESGGTAFAISNSDDIVGAVLSATAKVTHEAMYDVKLDIEGVDVGDLAPARIGSLYRGQQLVLFGHYRGHGAADVTLRARVSGRPVSYRTRFDFPAVAKTDPEVERLWAFAAIEDHLQEIADFGEDADRKQAVVDLAVEHGLVTTYTSMIVVRDGVFQQLGIDRRNSARLATEAEARKNRAAQPVASRRVDTAQPMFQSNRPGYGNGSGAGGSAGGGAGSHGALGLVLALVFAWVAWSRRKVQAGAGAGAGG
jgi:Ca-activated chloride channel family protein